MVRVVVRQRHLGAPVTLELGVETPAGLVDLVLVRVDHLRVRPGGDGLGDMEQSAGRQHVVMVEERDKLAGGKVEGGVGGGRDMAVLRAEDELDPRVLFPGVREHLPHVTLGRGIVGDAQLPVRIKLRGDGGEQLGEERGRGVVNGDDDADLRTGPGQRGGFPGEIAGEPRGQPVVVRPEGIGILLLPGRGRGGLGGPADHFLGQLRAGQAHLAPEARPAFHDIIPGERAADKRPDGAGELPLVVKRDGAGVLVDLVEKNPLGAQQLARTVGILGEDLEAGGAEVRRADVHEAVEGRAQGLRPGRVVAEHVLALLAPDEPVLVHGADGGDEARDGAAHREGPAADAEFLVVGVDPVLRQVEEADEVVLRPHFRGVHGDLAQHALRLAHHHAVGLVVKMPVEIIQAFADQFGPQDRPGPPGGHVRATGRELGAQELSPHISGPQGFQGERPGAEPGPHRHSEAGAPGRQPALQKFLQVGPVQAHDAVGNDAIELGAQVGQLLPVLGVNPAADVDLPGSGLPGCRLIDEVLKGGFLGH